MIEGRGWGEREKSKEKIEKNGKTLLKKHPTKDYSRKHKIKVIRKFIDKNLIGKKK